MKFQALLFDVDGTLLDFKKTERTALEYVGKEFQIPDQKPWIKFYQTLNASLWKGFEQGKYEKQFIFDTRFQTLLDHFQMEGNGIAMEHRYREYLNKGCDTIKDAHVVIEELSKRYDLYIVTNGVAKTQHLRLENAQLKHYFKDIFVSETIRHQKPDPAYFAYVCDHIPYEKTKLLIIGDSLSSDIAGAKAYGMQSCWFNPEKKKAKDILPDMEIHALIELLERL